MDRTKHTGNKGILKRAAETCLAYNCAGGARFTPNFSDNAIDHLQELKVCRNPRSSTHSSGNPSIPICREQKHAIGRQR